MDAELAPWVALASISGLGNEGMRQLLQAFGTPQQVFAASANALKQPVKPAVASIQRIWIPSQTG